MVVVDIFSCRHIFQNGPFHAISKIMMESDSVLVVDLLSIGNSHNHLEHQLIRGVLDIGSVDADFQWRKIDRDGKCMADSLAKHSNTLNVVCNSYDTILNFLSQAINSE